MNWKKRGLDRHAIGDVAHAFEIKHRPHCREHNPGGGSHLNGCPDKVLPRRESIFGGYHCVCDFGERVQAAIMAIAFDGVDADL